MKEIEIGDLVRVVGKEWASSYEAIGIVTEVKDLVHKPSNKGYTAVTALVRGEYHTLSEKDFVLLSKAKKTNSD